MPPSLWQAANLLVTPLPQSAGAFGQSQASNPADLIRNVLSSILAAVLDVWTCPALPSAGPAVTAALVTALGRCTEGIGPAALGLLRAGASSSARAEATAAAAAAGGRGGFRPDPVMVQTIVDMGFTQVCQSFTSCCPSIIC